MTTCPTTQEIATGKGAASVCRELPLRRHRSFHRLGRGLRRTQPRIFRKPGIQHEHQDYQNAWQSLTRRSRLCRPDPLLRFGSSCLQPVSGADQRCRSQPNASAFSSWDDYKNKALQWLKDKDNTVNSSHEFHNHHQDVKHHGGDTIKNVTADAADANSVSSWFTNKGTVVEKLTTCAGCASTVSACNATANISMSNSDCKTTSNTASYTQTTGVTMTGTASYGPASVSVEGSVTAEKSTSSSTGSEVCSTSSDTMALTNTYYEKYLNKYTLSGGATSLIKYEVPQGEYQVYCTNVMSGTYHYGAYMDTSRMLSEYKNPVVGVQTSWDYVDEAAQMTVQSLQTPSCPAI